MYIYTLKKHTNHQDCKCSLRDKIFFRKQSKVRKYINIVLKEKLTI